MRKRCLKILFILILIIILVYNNAFANASYANWGRLNDVKDDGPTREDRDPNGGATGKNKFFAIEIYPGKITQGSGILDKDRGNALPQSNTVNISNIYNALLNREEKDYANVSGDTPWRKPLFWRSRIFLDVASDWAGKGYRAPTLVIDTNIANGYTRFDYGLSDSRYGSDSSFNGGSAVDHCKDHLCMATIQIKS